MSELGVFEAKNKLSALLDQVEQGAEIVITRHGRPVARLVPHAAQRDQAQTDAAMERIRARAKQLKPGVWKWAKLKKDRDAGRP